MKWLVRSAVLAAMLLVANILHAQLSGVDLSAIEATTPIPANEVPLVGTFYSAAHPQWPPYPGNIGLPAWPLDNNNKIFLVDDIDYSPSGGGFHAMDDPGGMFPGGSGDGGDGGSNIFSGGGWTMPTNGLWLWITNVAEGTVYANLNGATDYVYAVISATNLTASSNVWNIETEVFPGIDTNTMPFTVPMNGRNSLFLSAMDWTGITNNGNETPQWWFYYWFGLAGLDLLDGDLDPSGNTFLYDYTNGLDPNVISFSIVVTNQYVNTDMVPMQLEIQGGIPDHIAVVDATNFTATGESWYPYVSSNIVADLPWIEGQQNIWIGLKGLPTNATVTWQEITLTMQTNAPAITVTNPVAATVSDPMIEVQGFANESLSSLRFDVSNATGQFTSQTGYVTDEFYDTNLEVYTTNYFQLFDVRLTNGLNTITIHATDLAGNTGTSSFNVTLDYSGDTTPPALNIVWPQDGTLISGSSFTLHAQVDDALDSVTAMIVDSSGDTNTVTVSAQRNGNVWASGLPVAPGTNFLTVTAINPVGNSITTNLTLVQSAVMVTMNPLPSGEFNQSSVSVTGTISDTNDSLTVNGVGAYYLDTNGDWEADNVPVNAVGMAVFDLEVYVGDPVNDGSQQIPVLQPPVVSVYGYTYDDYSWENWHLTDTTFDGTNITQNCWQPYTDNSWIFWTAPQGGQEGAAEWVPYGLCADGPTFYGDNYSISPGEFSSMSPPWFNANYTGSGIDEGDPWNETTFVQTTITLDTGGEGQVGTTNLYLISAEAFDNYYAPGDLPLPPESLTILGQTLQDSDTTNSDGTRWGYILLQLPSGTTNLNITPMNDDPDYGFNVQAYNVTPQLLADLNRTGNLNSLTTMNNPYRFWINDASESGDISSSDNAIPGSTSPNYALNQVNGHSDLVNFSPVALCLSNALQLLPLTNGWEYHLSQADSAVKFVYTSLTLTNAFDYLTNVDSYGYGTNADEWATNADTIQVLPSGASGKIFDTNWLAQVQTNGGTGVILLEGCTSSTNPMMLEIWHNGQEMGSTPLFLSISGVEQMYRWVNLRGAIGAPQTRATDTSEPANNPDSLSDGKNFVFVHGYNVSETSARGWGAEMFKRLYQSGSKAKYYVVDWDGSQSQGDYVSGDTANYQTNVVNAFLTAPYLATFINGLSGSTALAGHSLGNMVCLSAISDSGAAPSQYFMIDAAVPMEAIDGTVPINNDMVNTNVGGGNWLAYSNRLWASDWYNLWTNTDARSTLTWSNRLANLGSVDVYNFYSSGEDVLRDYPGTPPSSLISLLGTELVEWIFDEDLGTYVWAWQEKNKGLMSGNSILSSNHGGWLFNDAALNPNSYTTYTVAMANAIPPAQLQTNAFFDFGWGLTGDYPDYDYLQGAGGSSYAAANRNRILSDAIPALTLPIGVNSVDRLAPDGQPNRNFDMQANFENGWPLARQPANVGASAVGEWHHSDLCNVAYSFNYNLFSAFVTIATLK